MTPTQRTLNEARKRGWQASVVEKWIPQTRRRVDVWGFGDVLAAGGGSIYLIQATSGSNSSARYRKIVEDCAEPAKAWLDSGGRILVWGWRKYKKPVDRKFWRAYEIEITKADFLGGISIDTGHPAAEQ